MGKKRASRLWKSLQCSVWLALLSFAGCVTPGYPGARLPKTEVAIMRCAAPLTGVVRVDDFEVMKNDGRYGRGTWKQSRGVQVRPGPHELRFCWYYEEGSYAHWRRFTVPFEVEAGRVYVARVAPEKEERSAMARLVLGPKINRSRFAVYLLDKETREEQVFRVGGGEGNGQPENEK